MGCVGLDTHATHPENRRFSARKIHPSPTLFGGGFRKSYPPRIELVGWTFAYGKVRSTARGRTQFAPTMQPSVCTNPTGGPEALPYKSYPTSDRIRRVDVCLRQSPSRFYRRRMPIFHNILCLVENLTTTPEKNLEKSAFSGKFPLTFMDSLDIISHCQAVCVVLRTFTAPLC